MNVMLKVIKNKILVVQQSLEGLCIMFTGDYRRLALCWFGVWTPSLEGSVISPSSEGSPGPVSPIYMCTKVA